MNFLAQKRSKIFLDSTKVSSSNNGSLGDSNYREISAMIGLGGWHINFKDRTLLLDNEAKNILELPFKYIVSAKGALSFFPKSQLSSVKALYTLCRKELPFTTTIKMKTYQNEKFWAKITGKPIFINNEIIGVKGVFQNITQTVKKEKRLEVALKQIAFQNKQIIAFSSIITNELKSQAGNLGHALELLKDSNNDTERDELTNNLNTISHNITDTLSQLNKLITVQSKVKNPKVKLDFKESLSGVTSLISNEIIENNTGIYSDFSEVPFVYYYPEYLTNIFHKLIENSINHASPERKLEIDIFSYKEKQNKCLLIKDNGIGIDQSKLDSIFNLYTKEAFNYKSINNVGFGLFVFKNQIEAMRGSITASSVLNQGTTFKITL